MRRPPPHRRLPVLLLSPLSTFARAAALVLAVTLAGATTARADAPVPAPRPSAVAAPGADVAASVLPAAAANAPFRLDAFGFPTRPYAVETVDIDASADLADTFEAVGLAAGAAERLAEWAERDLGLAQLDEGHVLHVYRENGVLSHLVYEDDVTTYVVLKPGVLPVVRRLAHPVEVAERADALVLRGPLDAAVRRAGLDGALADSVRAAFGSRLGFAAFRRGGTLSVVLEEERVGGVVLATRVKAVRLVTASGKTHEAFRVEADSAGGFFDGDGVSLGDLFLRSPIEDAYVTSRWSMNRFHPVDSVWRPHLGTDFAAAFGTPVLSVGDGVVLEAGFSGGNGNYVKVRHDGVYTSGYLHFSKIAPGIRPGVRVPKGDVVGYVGMTGLATGPHVCFRYWKGGAQIDFLAAPMPPAAPLDDALRPAFADERDRLRRLFDVPTLADQVFAPLVMPSADFVPTLMSLEG